MNYKNFSVIIPAHNEEINLGRVLDSLSNCVPKGIISEIVVVDDESTDDTVAVAYERGVRVITNEPGKRLTIAGLRNLGARSTSAALLAFLDADILVPPEWLELAMSRFNSGFNGALGFTDKAPIDASWVGRVWGNRSDSPHSDKATDFLPGRNILITRAAFDAVGGFDETLTTCEDKEFTYRLCNSGYPVIRISSAILIHLGSERSLGEFLRKEFWRQSATFAFAKQHGFAFRTLRNPLLSLWHLCCACYLVTATLYHAGNAAVVASVLWLIPSAIFTLRNAWSLHHYQDLPLVFLLTWLRWNVSGLALIWQIFNYHKR